MTPVIDLQQIARFYTIGEEVVYALREVSLVVNRNEYVALMGPSGSGKSTLMNIIGCLDTPSTGKYLLNGEAVSAMGDDQLAAIRNKEIGFVFQAFNLLSRYSALENVMLPLLYAGIELQERKELAIAALTQVGLGNRMHHKPNEMSGGQKQRVAIARALVNKPFIILADEPTGNLDTKTSVEIMALLRDLHEQGNTIVLVTHEEDIANYAKRVVRLRDGVIEQDSALVHPLGLNDISNSFTNK